MNNHTPSVHFFKLNSDPDAYDNVEITTTFTGNVINYSTDQFWDCVIQDITITQDNVPIVKICLPDGVILTPLKLNEYSKDLNQFKNETMLKNISDREKDKLRQQALAKLTPEEIQILEIE